MTRERDAPADRRNRRGPEVADEQVLDSLATAMGLPRDEPHGLHLTSAPRHLARSTIYRVGDRSTPSLGSRWLVKRPYPMVEQEDLANPLDAEQQFCALRRLHEHFVPLAATARVPVPLVVLGDVDALAMEYVHGTAVSQLLRVGSALRSRPVLHAVRTSARLLAHLHRLEDLPPVRVDTGKLAGEVFALEARSLSPVGLRLPARLRSALRRVPALRQDAVVARLHGDFAPGNVLIERDGCAVCIDAALQPVGLPEDDLARFLTMLSVDHLFLAGAVAPPLAGLRRRLEREFVASYYLGCDPGQRLLLLELRRLPQLCLRWLRRHVTRSRNERSAAALRRAAVDSQFAVLFAESARRLEAGL